MRISNLTFFSKLKDRKLVFPIYALLAASILLVIILAFLTYLNFNREKKLLKEHLFRQGLTLIRALEAGAKTGMMEMMWGPDQLHKLFYETAKGPNVYRIILTDENGYIIEDSQENSPETNIADFTRPENEQSVLRSIVKIGDENIFRIIKQFKPISSNMMMNSTMMNRCMGNNWMNRWNTEQNFIILDLKMQEYEAAQKEDIRLGLISAFILLMLGTASFYFLLLAQNYYVVNHTLKSMKSYTQNVVESMPNGLISLDKEGRIETINRRAMELLHLEQNELKGKPLGEILTNCELFQEIHKGKDFREHPVDCHLNNGEIIPLSLTTSRLTDENGSVIGSVFILRDLREIRALEKRIERSERLASLGRMAAGIAHEIRNPLSSIKGFAQYFGSKFTRDTEDWNYANVMAKEVDRLNRVIQDLLNFARPQEPELNPVELQPLIDHVLKILQSEISEKGIQVIEKFDPEPPITVIADSDLISQVFLNIFLNAIESMDSGGVLEIDVRVNNKNAEIEIRDSGTGIPEEALPKIFDPFFTTKKEGTGLGLATVYRIIENHQGDIEVKSRPGEGTVFIIKLPIKREAV